MLTTLLRFRDLKTHRYVRDRGHLSKLQRSFGFPKGRLIGAGVRVWTPEEIADWLAACPVEIERKPSSLSDLADHMTHRV